MSSTRSPVPSRCAAVACSNRYPRSPTISSTRSTSSLIDRGSRLIGSSGSVRITGRRSIAARTFTNTPQLGVSRPRSYADSLGCVIPLAAAT
ncbi:MAG TPA: hypothetical protein VFB74_06105, partial [Kribbellaceae bacterium]|nr:hypothetical protein [Kribbellaceae bacterium]